MERNNRNVLKQMRNKIKSHPTSSSSLWFALQEEKETQRLAERFAATKNSATATLLQWSKGEQNQLFVEIFGKVAELNWMWKAALDEFSNQYSNYQQQLKVLCDTEKEIDEYNKELLACHSKVVKAKKQWEAALKKGDESRIITRDDELKTMSSQYSSMKLNVAAAITKLEHKKVERVQTALKEQANAFVNLAGKCQAIFTAQRAMTAIFPQNDITTSVSNYQIFFDNLCKLIGSLSKKLGMTPPREGGIDLYESTELSESQSPPSPPEGGAANKSGARHSTYVEPEKIAEIKDKGNIGLPVPPRSQQSLEIPSYYYYVTPNETNIPGRPASETVLGYTKILGDNDVYTVDKIYADKAEEDDEKIYDSVSQPRIPQLQETKETEDTDLWYAVTVVDKEMQERDALRLSRSYSDPQNMYSDTGTEMKSQSQEHLDEENSTQSLSLPNAHHLKKSHSTPSSRDATPSPPVDDLSQEKTLQEKKPEEESKVFSVQSDTNQLKESNCSPTSTDIPTSSPGDHESSAGPEKSEVTPSQSPNSQHVKETLSRTQSFPQSKADHQALQSHEPEEKSSSLTEAKQIGELQSSSDSTFRDVTTSPPQFLADHTSSTKPLKTQKSEVISSRSPLLPSDKLLKESSSLSGLSSPWEKSDHQVLQSHEPKEKLPKSSDAKQTGGSSSTCRDDLPPQSLAESTSPTKPFKPQKPEVISSRSPLLPSAKLLQGSSSLPGQSSPQGKTGHLPPESQGSEKEKSVKSPNANQLRASLSPPPSKNLSTSTPQCKTDDLSVVDQGTPSEKEPSKMQKSYVKKQSVDSIKTQGSGNTKFLSMDKTSPVLWATQSLDVDDGVSKSHLLQSSSSLDNPSNVSSNVKDETKLSSSGSNNNKPVNNTATDEQNTPPSIVGVESGNIAELNKDIYSFVASALQPQSTPDTNQSSLSDIFKRHCQKFEQLSKPGVQSSEVSHKGKDGPQSPEALRKGKDGPKSPEVLHKGKVAPKPPEALHKGKVAPKSPEALHKEKDDAKLVTKSSQPQKGAGPQRKKPQLPPRPKEATK